MPLCGNIGVAAVAPLLDATQQGPQRSHCTSGSGRGRCTSLLLPHSGESASWILYIHTVCAIGDSKSSRVSLDQRGGYSLRTLAPTSYIWLRIGENNPTCRIGPALEVPLKRLAAMLYRLRITRIDRHLDRLMHEHVQSANCHCGAQRELQFDALAIQRAVFQHRLDRCSATLS